MKKNIIIYTVLAIFNLLFLVLSDLWGGATAGICLLVGYAVPFWIGEVIARRDKIKREEEAGVCEASALLFQFKPSLAYLLPMALPVCLILFLLAYLTSLLAALAGVSTSSVPEGNVFVLAITSVLAPVLVEEAFFRYLPYKLLAPYSYKATVIFSSVAFAVAHLYFYKIPYALVAGLIFIVLNMAFQSMWPSVILHAINNILAVIWIKAYAAGWGNSFIAVTSVLAALSLIFVFVFFKRYVRLFKLGFKAAR